MHGGKENIGLATRDCGGGRQLLLVILVACGMVSCGWPRSLGERQYLGVSWQRGAHQNEGPEPGYIACVCVLVTQSRASAIAAFSRTFFSIADGYVIEATTTGGRKPLKSSLDQKLCAIAHKNSQK